MNDPNVPSLSYILDALTVRIEYDEGQGLVDEHRALVEARAVIEAHVFGELRNRSIIALIRQRLARRFAA